MHGHRMTTSLPPPGSPDELTFLDRLASYIAAPGWNWARTWQLAVLITVGAGVLIAMAVCAPAVFGYLGAASGGYAVAGRRRGR
jgi:hypothetical protein